MQIDLLFYILVFTIIGGVLSLVGGLLLLIRPRFAQGISHLLASFAAGALLGAAFFDLLPESLHTDNTSMVFLNVLLGILFFFLLERFLHWYHHHSSEVEAHRGKPIVPLIVVGDTIHNFIDGIAIAATFMISIPLGIVTAIAVGAHEIPQEIGDFGVLLKQKLKSKKIILINVFSSLAAVLGAVLMFIFGEHLEQFIVPVILPVTAGFFIYIALSDLIPEIHQENRRGFALKETIMLILGIVVMYVVIEALHSTGLHDHGTHSQEELHTSHDENHEHEDHHAEEDHDH